MSGLEQIGGHRRAHVSESDKGDLRHGTAPACCRGQRRIHHKDTKITKKHKDFLSLCFLVSFVPLWLFSRCYLFCHCGLRFSRKALTPSFWSSLSNSATNSSRSSGRLSAVGRTRL